MYTERPHLVCKVPLKSYLFYFISVYNFTATLKNFENRIRYFRLILLRLLNTFIIN